MGRERNFIFPENLKSKNFFPENGFMINYIKNLNPY